MVDERLSEIADLMFQQNYDEIFDCPNFPDPEDALVDYDLFSELYPDEVQEHNRAGVDDLTDTFVFMEMNGRNIFVTGE